MEGTTKASADQIEQELELGGGVAEPDEQQHIKHI